MRFLAYWQHDFVSVTHCKPFSNDDFAERTTALETTIASLQTQLQEQEAEADNAISQWQDACAATEEKCTGLETELQALKDIQMVLGEASHKELEEKLAQKESELEEAQSTIESNKDSIQEMKGLLTRVDRASGFDGFLFLTYHLFSDQISSLQSTVAQKEADAVITAARLREQLELSENKSQQLQNELESALSNKEDEYLQEENSIREQNEGTYEPIFAPAKRRRIPDIH